MRLGPTLVAGARTAAAGVVAGALWWLVETVVNRLAGGAVPGRALATIAVVDVALGGAAGAVLGVALGLRGRALGGAALGLALAGAFGFLRVYEPPGMGSELLFAVVAAAVAIVGLRVAGREREGALAFLHVTLLATTAVVLGQFLLEERGVSFAGVRLPLVFATLPLVGVLADGALAVVVGRRGVRLGVELAAAGLAALVWGAPLATTPLVDPIVTAVPPPAGTPDVIVVSLDTTRADHLSTYGYGRETSPQLTAFAADALRFTQARSTAAWTLPGHASLFTGTYPSRHGAVLAGAWLGGQSIDGRRRVAFPLASDRVTLAEALRDHGFRTAALVANFSYLYRDWGLAQGFDRYDDAPGLLLRATPHAVRFARRFAPGFCLKPYRSARAINAAALGWLDAQPRDRPAFLFLNYMEPHQPWLAPAPYDRWSRALPGARRLAVRNLYTHAVHPVDAPTRAFVTANYDGQVAAMDAALGELFDALRARGRYENALIVVTSDHGEFLGEHDQLGHIGRMLYEPVLHVPLIVKFPGAERLRGTADTPVQLVDVLPTVLDTVGAAQPAGVQGQVLPHVDRPSFAEEEINPFLVANYGEAYNRGIRVIYDGAYKLITTSRGERMLFDLARDPEETTNLASVEPERTAILLRRLREAFDARAGTAEALALRDMRGS